LRTDSTVVSHNLATQLTSFVGRQAEMDSLREVLAGNRVVTPTAAGGVGKTRLAVQMAAQLARRIR
jgi:Mrp family chromosome partitioning ATPase